jgi:hypothetical protein
VTRRAAGDDDEGVAEPVAKGLVRAWLAAKLLPIAVRLATWAAWLSAMLAYVGFVVWKVRRLTKKGALDAPEPGGPPTPVSAKERGVVAWIRGDEPLGMGTGSGDDTSSPR